jgi:hypothetical protein
MSGERYSISSGECPKPYRQALQAAKNDHAATQVELLRRYRHLQRRHGVDDLFDRALHFLSREHCADTEVDPAAEGQMLAEIASIQVEFVRRLIPSRP